MDTAPRAQPLAEPQTSPVAPRRRGIAKFTPRLNVLVRRVHMYAGLALLPWVLFFGLSGMLFNHPNVGEQVVGQPIRPATLQQLSGLQAWQADVAAQRVVEALNQKGHGSYRLDPTFASRFEGTAVFGAEAPEGRYMLLLNMERASGVLVTSTRRSTPEGSHFPELALGLSEYSTQQVEEHVSGLLKASGLPEIGALRAHPKIAPELRLRVRDEHGKLWNLTYDTRTGNVSGRAADAFPSIGITQLLAKLHTTHHFPFEIGALWFWALFEDLLGLTMVLWGVSGLVMWWQIKRTRVAGLLSIGIAVGVALAIMVGTANHLTFGKVQQQMGPGE